MDPGGLAGDRSRPNEIRDEGSEARSNRLLLELQQCGYHSWVIFDDRGYFVTGTDDIRVVTGLNRYLRETWLHDRQKRICNYDVLAVPAAAGDIYEKIWGFYTR